MTLENDFETWIVWLTYLPLVLASIAGFGLTMVLAVEYRRLNVFPKDVRDTVFSLIDAKDFAKALVVVEGQSARAKRLVAALLAQAGRSSALLKERATQIGGAMSRELESGLGGLSLIASLGPLFGLFGTVVGIVLVFNRLSADEAVASPQQLAGGIGTALYTTIFGLIVGILALVTHRYFSSRLDRLVAELEETGLDVVERLSGSAQ